MGVQAPHLQERRQNCLLIVSQYFLLLHHRYLLTKSLSTAPAAQPRRGPAVMKGDVRIVQHWKPVSVLRGLVGRPLSANMRLLLFSPTSQSEQTCPTSCAMIVASEFAAASTRHGFTPEAERTRRCRDRAASY